jgi:HD superfamily phosphodiesterase
MSSQFALSIDSDLAERLEKVDGDWLEKKLASACDEFEGRRGGEELAAYDSQEELKQDPSLSEVERKQLLIKWRRRIGGPQR